MAISGTDCPRQRRIVYTLCIAINTGFLGCKIDMGLFLIFIGDYIPQIFVLVDFLNSFTIVVEGGVNLGLGVVCENFGFVFINNQLPFIAVFTEVG